MQLSIKKAIVLLALSAAGFTACNKQLEEYNPSGLTVDAILSTPRWHGNTRECGLYLYPLVVWERAGI